MLWRKILEKKEVEDMKLKIRAIIPNDIPRHADGCGKHWLNLCGGRQGG